MCDSHLRSLHFLDFQNECSFVSLRDVERAMIVFEYFISKMNIFGPPMNEWACRKQRHIDNEDEDELVCYSNF